MIYTLKLKINKTLAKKIIRIIDDQDLNSMPPNIGTTFINLQKLLGNIDTQILEDHLLYLEKEGLIEGRIYIQEYTGFIDYGWENKASNFPPSYFQPEYTLKLQIDQNFADKLLRLIKEQNRKGVHPKINSSVQEIARQSQADLFYTIDHLIYLQRKGKIQKKYYTKDKAIGFEDIIYTAK